MGYQTVFKRQEIKYLISRTQYEQIKQSMEEYMNGDEYGRSNICNIYFDTPDFLLIRRSMEKPVYKEKLRVRTYGTASQKSTTFVEIKKKYKSTVYKRRISMLYPDAVKYLCNGEQVIDTQISHEIDYFLNHYGNLQPTVFLSYEREAFYAKHDHEFRITFDENILWRDYDLSLTKGIYGLPILKPDQILMEIKTGTSIPLWMVEILSKLHIYKTSFSKYGNAYQAIFLKEHQKEVHSIAM